MRRRKKWFFLWILIPALVVGIFGYLFIHYFLDPTLYQKMVEKSLTTELGREVVTGKAKISFWGGIGIAFEDLRVKDRSLGFDLLQAKSLILGIEILPLLKREVKWKHLVLDRPILHLLRDKNRKLNIFDGTLSAERLKTSQEKMVQILSTLFGGSITIRDGKISFSDEALGPSPLVTEIGSFNLHLSKVSHSRPFPFRLSGEIRHSKKEGRFSIAGTIQNIPEDMDLAKGKIRAKVEIKGIETLHFWPYLKAMLPMKTISGNLDLDAHYQGDFQGTFKASAKLRFKELVFDYPEVFAYTLEPKWMNLDLSVDYDRKDLRVPQLSVELPEVRVKAKGRIYDIGSKEMGLDAEAQSDPFELSQGRKFIPYRIITPDVSQPLFRAEGSGPVQILSVKLSGKIPEIEHCDQPVHAHTLSVEMKVDGAQLKLPWNLPLLENVKGYLDFRDGHLNLKEVEGRVFHSIIDRANGTFYQLLLVPTLQIHSEGRMDLKDLSSFMKIEGLSDDRSEFFSRFTVLSGRADYRLFTKVVLKPPLHFQHQGSYRLWKARFTLQQIPFPILIEEGKMELSNDGLRWSGAKVEFGDSSFLMDGSWRRGEKGNPFEMMVRGRGDLKNLLSLAQSPLFSEEIRSKTEWIEDLSGVAELSLRGEGLAGLKFSSYEGEVIPKGVHLLPKGIPFPILFKEGGLSFSNLGVTFSNLKAQSGSSSLTLEGVIQEENIDLSTWGAMDLKPLYTLLRSPFSPEKVRAQMDGIQEITGEAEGRLKWLGRTEQGIPSPKEGEIRLNGVSLLHQKIPVPLSHIEGSLLLTPEQIRFVGLKGMVGTSPLTFSGALSRTQFPKPEAEKASPVSDRLLSFQIYSPQLDLDPLLPKREGTTPTSFEKLRDWLSIFSFDGKVEVDRGKFRGLQYQDLKVGMKTVNGKLLLYPFQFKGFGGDLWGEGWIQPKDKGIRFEIKPRFSNMEAKLFLRTLLQKGEEEKIAVTGRVYIDKVELRGEGEDFQKVKESLEGKLRLELENGVIEKGNILAKIFSILNVSQWFWGRLPDLKTKGLPYRNITATILVNGGVASTEDFLVDSDAIRITLVGKVDLGKNLIDATIGVHPLVTLDMVLSHLPIAGYIITGKDNAFLSYIYEAKGDMDDPKIEAVPIKGLGENFLGIIQRLLETPIRPFQKVPSNNK
jgi:uncharacterized protein involved in outer membrane biogenesis